MPMDRQPSGDTNFLDKATHSHYCISFGKTDHEIENWPMQKGPGADTQGSRPTSQSDERLAERRETQ